MIVVVLALGVLGGMVLSKSMIQNIVLRGERTDKLAYTLSMLENKYVDSLTRDSIVEMIVPSLLSKLDPHSTYITKEEFARSNEPLTGHFDGIGVMFNMMTDTALITNVISGGPSYKAGVEAGDMIITVNDSIISGRKMDQEKVISLLRGKKGTTARLGILRPGSENHIYIDVIRDVVPIRSLEASYIIDDSIGYIKFTRFAASTYKEVIVAMETLKNSGANSYIFDLRGNMGGYLDQAIYLCNEFLPARKLIVYTEGAHFPRNESRADGRGRFQDTPIVIMIDESSASASEIMAGAIQDNDRGVIIGRRSFGKGLVQEQITFPDNSAARITIAKYFTPIGRSIQKPYTAGNGDDYEMEIVRRIEHSELFNSDSIEYDQSQKFITPQGRIVYGGGGISPDIFVPIDTSKLTTYFKNVFAKNLIFKYAQSLTANNRKTINKITNMDELKDFFKNREIILDFVKYADRNGVKPPSQEDLRKDKKLIESQIKGYVGRNTTLEDNAYYYYMYPFDNTTTRAVEILKTKETDKAKSDD